MVIKVFPELLYIKQEGITLWTGFKGNGFIHDGDDTFGHGLTMGIAKGLTICERTCFTCIARIDPKASEQEEGKSSLIDQCLPRRKHCQRILSVAVFTEAALRQFFNTTGLLEADLPKDMLNCNPSLPYHPLYFAETLVENPVMVADIPVEFSGIQAIAKVMAFGDYVRAQSMTTRSFLEDEAAKYPYKKRKNIEVK